VQNGRIDKAETGNGEIKAKAFVYNGPIMQLFEVLDPNLLPPDEQAYVTGFEPTSGISIDYALTDRVSELEGGVIGIDHWLGGYFPSNVDPTLAPAGKQLSTWFIPLAPADIGSKKKRDQAEQILRQTIQAHFPAFFDKVMWERKIVCTVLDGVHLKVGQSFADRAPLQSATIDNLWFAGDTAKGKGCSSGIAFESALGVADQLPRFL
jgi:prolycopene isomerase